MLKEITVASALVALLVLSGCGSSSSGGLGEDGTPVETGIEVPEALSQKADINAGMAGEFLHSFYENNIASAGSVKSNFSAKNLQNIKIASKPASDDGNETAGGPCTDGGSFSYKKEITNAVEGDMNVTTTTIDCSASNCIMDADGYSDNSKYLKYCRPQRADWYIFLFYMISNNPQMAPSKNTFNGTYKAEMKHSESMADAHVWTDEYSIDVDNLTYISNGSSDIENYYFSDGVANIKIEHDSIIKRSLDMDYKYKFLDRNKTNPAQIRDGESGEYKLDWTLSRERDATSSKENYDIDGYGLIYNMGGSEDNKTMGHNTFAYDNLTFKKVTDGNITTLDINGGASVSFSCFKMVDVSTDKLVEHNKTFKDEDGNTGDNVLPYDGKVTLKGDNTAVATFKVNDVKETSMDLEIDDAVVGTYYGWDEVPTSSCDVP